MNIEEVITLVNVVFEKIIKASSQRDLEDLLNNELLNKYVIDNTKYPQIKFHLSSLEIENLKKDEIINSENLFNENSNEKIKDPLAKLLYALAWKNGDLHKIKHIINGIQNNTDISYILYDRILRYILNHYNSNYQILFKTCLFSQRCIMLFLRLRI